LDIVSSYPPGSYESRTVLSLTEGLCSFAPNSTRATTDQSKLNDNSTEAAFDAQEYHYVHGRVIYSPEFEDGMKIATVEGKDLTITIVANGTMYVNDAKILYTNYLISTGVVHVIEWTLDPNNTEARPDLTNSTSPTNSTTTPVPSSSSLSTGAKAGIGVGVALGALLVIGLIFFFVRRRKRANHPAGTGNTETEKKQLGPVEMPQPEKAKPHELYSPNSGQAWEMDGTDSQRGRAHEME
jgi:LPXTG-motif cell wall-anchored protein